MTELSTTPPHEEKQIRCPKLGGPVHFDYCRMEERGRPCSRALSCWSAHFNVDAYFRMTLSTQEFERCFMSPQRSKVSTIIELIERARKIAQEEGSDKDQLP